MVFFFNYEPPSRAPVLPVTRAYGRAVGVYTFGLAGTQVLKGVQGLSLRVTWEPSFEAEMQNRLGLPSGEILGPVKGTFVLEGLWVGDTVAAPAGRLRELIGQTFAHEGLTFRVKNVSPLLSNRDFMKVVLTGTATEGVDGNLGGGTTRVGQVLGYGPEGSPSVDIYGVWSHTIPLRVTAPVMQNHIPALGEDHPRFRFMKFQGCGEGQTRGGVVEIPLLYRGLPVSPGPSVPKADLTTAEQPIQTHPRFASLAGIDRIMDIIEALRRGDMRLGIFPGDDVPDVLLTGLALELYQRILRGNEAYLEPGATFTSVQYYSGEITDGGTPGTIQTPPGAPLFDNRNWLYTGLTPVYEGPGLVRAEKTWLLSARGGWDAVLY